jgi:hypothetical protein
MVRMTRVYIYTVQYCYSKQGFYVEGQLCVYIFKYTIMEVFKQYVQDALEISQCLRQKIALK